MSRFELMPNNVNPEKNDMEAKKSQINRIRNEVDQIVDAEGKGIEGGIKECVVALKVLGIPPQASCEGHTDKGQISAPWIEINNPDEPDERFIGQNNIFQQVATEKGLSFEDVSRSLNPDAYWEAMKRMPKQETQEFQTWENGNLQLLKKVKGIVEKFYQEYGEPENSESKIQFDDDFVGSVFRIYSGGNNYAPLEKNLSENDKATLQKGLIQYRAEMERYSGFLLEKYRKGTELV
jgi:hypothetical protein